MICTRCQGQNSDNVNFCVHCGAALRTTCPNCGTVNAPGARFCTSCGHAFGAASPAVSTQPLVVVKQGTSGWVWALVGILLGVIVIGGLGLGGILPLNFLKTATPIPLLPLPTVEQVLASTKTPTALASVETYCPQEGGVILYWNAGYDCNSESGDPGYRQRLGGGFQNLNTGGFDDQASAITIPSGWSVRLYENTKGKGASVCFNSPVANFEERGNFPDRGIPINDNVSSMEVFRDGTCGEDLAAGAEPAPFPKNVDLGFDAPALPGGEDGTGCTDRAPCACLPDILKELMGDNPPFNQDHARFANGILEAFDVDNETGEFVYGLDVDEVEPFLNGDLKVVLTLPIVVNGKMHGSEVFEAKCEPEDQGADGLQIQCRVQAHPGEEIPDPHPPEGQEQDPRLHDWYDENYQMQIDYQSDAVNARCFVDERDQAAANQFAPTDPTLQPVLQCPKANRPQVCGDQCCKKDDKCVQRGDVWKCDKASGPSKQCESWDTCCLNPSFPGCP